MMSTRRGGWKLRVLRSQIDLDGLTELINAYLKRQLEREGGENVVHTEQSLAALPGRRHQLEVGCATMPARSQLERDKRSVGPSSSSLSGVDGSPNFGEPRSTQLPKHQDL
jgi:hypothetical protein